MKPLIVVAAACFASASVAQPAARPDALDPSARVPPVAYRSVFSDYRPFAEQEPASWRALNEEVRRLGGHGGHVPKPAQKPAAKKEDKR